MGLREDEGFTLVEMLVAFVIMAAVAAMLYRGLSSGLRVSKSADGSESALLVAKARLAALGVETPLQAGTQAGRDGDVAWEIATRPYIAADGADHAARQQAFWATVTVNWRDRRGSPTRSLQLTTLKLGSAQ